MDLLGIDDAMARQCEVILEENRDGIFKPGFSRLNLPFFASDAQIDFILEAVIAVAKSGWALLPQYQLQEETGECKHKSQSGVKEIKLLSNVDFKTGRLRVHNNPVQSSLIEPAPSSYRDCLMKAEEIFDQALSTKVLLTIENGIISRCYNFFRFVFTNRVWVSQ